MYMIILTIYMIDRIRSVSRRTKPNSCNILIDEQSNPLYDFLYKDILSRHRGGNQLNQYVLSLIITLLSLK